MSLHWRRRLMSALQVWRHSQLQAGLAILGVAAGVCGLVTVLAIGAGAREEFNRALNLLGGGTLVVRAATADATLPAARVAAVQRLMGQQLRQLVPVAYAQRTALSGEARVDGVRVVQTGRDYQGAYRLQLHEGRFIGWYDQQRRARVCVLGWELGRALFPRGGAVGQSVRLGAELCTVVGWLAPGERSTVGIGDFDLPEVDHVAYVPLAPDAPAAAGDGLDELILRFTDESDMVRASGAVQRILEYDADGAAFEYIVPVELLRQKFHMQTVISYLLSGTTLVLLLVGGIGITNTMLMNVIRRRPEIGLRLAFGARRRDIVAQFVTESALVAALGGVAGLLAGMLTAAAVGWQLDWPVQVGLWTSAAGLVAAIVIGVLAGVYPAVQAASVEPIRSLNST